ncbi:branched-chain amino acid ABC transporter permease [Marinobacterium sedimentorum]|uniref:branched-chain amino acid ABC transporter permease n=1 Tax=Marinobacterium sedimentorum TaxID=2927804 RepID=UPI0020C7022F|nr:branched-chain amino acid ABC transporter permease [Marinobacterium sedimentorum]MCP8688714.1 branched-chain amino acid ABC transporter permease [Marinobacterium sedimentorum]
MKSSKILAMLVLLGVLVALPWIGGYATQRLMVEVFTLYAIALAWNLLAGYGGIVAVGQHVFIGIGAYSLFFLSTSFGLNPWLMLPAAVVITALFALLFALPMFRLRGAYFAVGTWVLAEITRIAVLNSDWLGAGAGMPLSTMMGITRWLRNAGIYWAALAVGVGSLGVVWWLLRGRLGLALLSVRDNEAAAAASGVNVLRTKVILWLVAAAITGLAGAVAYMNTLQVTPSASFSLNWTAAAIFIAVLGGIGTLEGPLIGVLVYFLLREMFSSYGSWYFIVLGCIAILTMLLAPGGAWSLLTRRRPLDPFGIRRMLS